MASQRYKFAGVKASDILQLSKDELALGNLFSSVSSPVIGGGDISLNSDKTGYSDGIMNIAIDSISKNSNIGLNVKVLDLSTLSLGSTFLFGKYQVESETPWAIEWEIVHQTDTYQIAQTKQIIDLRCFDAKESNNTDSDRSKYGNNNWQYSNIKQFLNSDKETWYSAQHSYDAPPTNANEYTGKNGYDTHKGFLYYFSDEEKSLLKDITLTLANNTITDGGGSYTWTGKVWLPTYTQMSGNQNNSISEGTKFDKYSDDNSRIKTINKYCAENNKYCIDNNKTEDTAWYYWMSSPYPSYSYRARDVASDGSPEDYSRAFNGTGGLAPCICLPRTLEGGVINDTISFYIDDTLYKSPKGYTFSQWVNTSYNYNGWYNNGTSIINYNTNTHIDNIGISDVIEDGKKYKSVANTITFSINGETLDAKPDATWKEWVDGSGKGTMTPSIAWSLLDNKYIVNSTENVHINNVIASDKIIENEAYWYSEGSTIAVDLSAVGLGSTFNFGKYQVESETPWAIEWEIVHQTDTYQIAQTKQIIDLRCFDAKESNNTDSNRSKYGNNNWQYSNIKQFLNSDKATWYSAQHSYDAPPNSSNVWSNYNPYDTHKGFLYYFSDEEKSLLKDMTFDLYSYENNTDGSYTWTGKVWLPTYTQMSGNTNNSISEGTKFDKYSDNNSRIKTIHSNCKLYNPFAKSSSDITSSGAWYYWMSSASPSFSYDARSVYSDGDPENADFAYFGFYGLAPCINIDKSSIIWGNF